RQVRSRIPVGHDAQVGQRHEVGGLAQEAHRAVGEQGAGPAGVQAAHAAPAAQAAGHGRGVGIGPVVDAVARIDAGLHPAAVGPARASPVVDVVGRLRHGDGVAQAVGDHGDLGVAVLAEHAPLVGGCSFPVITFVTGVGGDEIVVGLR